MRAARVFVSCGQRSDKEKAIGRAVYEYFKKKGFEAYFAERVQSPDALTENIFKFIRQSEYFVFIDFKRESISERDYRGSLFVNQELAISTFLGIQGIGFFERGTKREGILDYHIYNPFPFDDGTEIIAILDKETISWDKNSANEIKLIYEVAHVTRGVTITNNPLAPLSDWYHLGVINRNKKKHAYNCMGYVGSIIELPSKNELYIPTCELIWSGLGVFSVNIVGGTDRELDAFYILQNEDVIRFQHRPLTTTNPNYYLPQSKKENIYLNILCYRIILKILHNNFYSNSEVLIKI